jgi:hypothetical protein
MHTILFLKPKFLVIFLLTFWALTTKAQAQNKTEEPFTVENYYKIKWGYAKEFIDLWKKNHYPILKKAIEKGYILSVDAETPVLHSGEDTRWDFKVIIVFKNAQFAVGSPDLISPLRNDIYPDLVKLENDEQHRFELLIAHWDVMVNHVDLK